MTTAYGEREALAFALPTAARAGRYRELWERAVEVARALRACGVGKDGRVGVLMTNRPEWIAAVFGIVAGRRAWPSRSARSRRRPSWTTCCGLSGVSVLLFERTVLKKDFAAILAELEPEIGKDARCGRPGSRSCAASR